MCGSTVKNRRSPTYSSFSAFLLPAVQRCHNTTWHSQWNMPCTSIYMHHVTLEYDISRLSVKLMAVTLLQPLFSLWHKMTASIWRHCRTRLLIVGDRAFPVAAARIWNSIPQHITSAQSLPVFCSRLKTHLFRRCFPWLCCSAWEVTLSFSDTLIVFLTYLHHPSHLLSYHSYDRTEAINKLPAHWQCPRGQLRWTWLWTGSGMVL